MKTTQTPPSNLHPGWQILGELELPADSSMPVILPVWIRDTFASLHLHADFLAKIANSAQESAGRALQSSHVSTIGHIHLVAFAPADNQLKAGTWGFFRIEKLESAADPSFHDHAIELYLYQE